MATARVSTAGGPNARPLFFVGIAAVAVIALGRFGGLGDLAGVQTFTVIFTAIVVEAFPFVVLGAVVSAAIEVFVPDRAFARVARLPVALQLPAATLGGFAFPVCECGSVPVARRLIGRGLHPSAGLAFMLASPIFNPIVLASTWVAYSPRGLGLQMVGARAAGGVALALATGWALGGDTTRELLRPRPEDLTPDGETGRGSTLAGRIRHFLDHLTSDLFFMGKYLVAGAALAALLQTLLPQSLVAGIALTPVIGALALMAVAYVSSLCSEADAFVAVSFAQFPLGAQLAFLLFGPVLDLKLSFLYTATFRKRFVLRLALIAIPVTLAASLLFEVALR